MPPVYRFHGVYHEGVAATGEWFCVWKIPLFKTTLTCVRGRLNDQTGRWYSDIDR